MSHIKANSGCAELSATLLASLVLLAFVINFLCGCNKSKGAKAVTSSAVSSLKAKLPNLKPLDIESCSYTVDTSSAASGLPSPSDTRVEIKGFAVLSRAGSKALQSTYAWKSARRDDVPKSLLMILPPGDVLVSEKLNESFADNHPHLVHGYVVALAGNSWNQMYFVATDMDHPLK